MAWYGLTKSRAPFGYFPETGFSIQLCGTTRHYHRGCSRMHPLIQEALTCIDMKSSQLPERHPWQGVRANSIPLFPHWRPWIPHNAVVASSVCCCHCWMAKYQLRNARWGSVWAQTGGESKIKTFNKGHMSLCGLCVGARTEPREPPRASGSFGS